MVFFGRWLSSIFLVTIVIPLVATFHPIKFAKPRTRQITRLKEKSHLKSVVWGSWSKWTDCSRTCGGGVSFSIRKCNKGYENWCHKEVSKKFKTCNNQDCPKDSIDYRARQCSAYNDVLHKRKLHEWIPVENDERQNRDDCALICKALDDHSVIVQWSDRVMDGTRCSKGSSNICIAGKCELVGCDRVLHSSFRFDMCGVCGGDGSTCKHESGLRMPDKNKVAKRDFVGSKQVMRFPKNSRHVVVTEKGTGQIDLRIGTQSLKLPKHNGNFKRDILNLSDVAVEYGTASKGKYYINVKGSLTSEMEVVISYDNADWKYIRYEYYRPLIYKWSYDKASNSCSVSCGVGLRYTRAKCFEVISGNLVEDEKCLKDSKETGEPKVEHCNVFRCVPSYSGDRFEHTFEHMEYYRWLKHPWTDCSRTCGGGIQTRYISCYTESLNGDLIFDDTEAQCSDVRPIVQQKCNIQACPEWEAQEWSTCSVTCGIGEQYRIIRCLHKDGSSAFGCHLEAKPVYSRVCTVETPCPQDDHTDNITPDGISGTGFEVIENDRQEAAYVARNIEVISFQPKWNAQQWGECSVTCGSGGFKMRIVNCQVHVASHGILEYMNDEACSSYDAKPNTRMVCTMDPCPMKMNQESTEVIREWDAPTWLGDDADVSQEVFRYQDNDRTVDIEQLTAEEYLSQYDDDVTEQTTSIDDSDYLNYRWKYEENSSCTPSCGQGERFMSQLCYHRSSGARAASDRCDPESKQAQIVESCNDQPCTTTFSRQEGEDVRWEIGPYGQCSVSCGRGVQSRPVVCRRMPEGIADTRPRRSGVRLPDIMCPSPRPPTTRACSLVGCAPEWIPDQWSQCSRTCGRGVQQRDLRCTQRLATGSTVQVPQDYCSRIRPVTRRKCAMLDCPPRYIVKQWSKCSETCGWGAQIRELMCMQVAAGEHRAREVDFDRCSQLPLPVLKRNCRHRKCPDTDHTHTGSLANRRIQEEHRIYVQTSKESKIRLVAGMRAYVYSRVTVIMRCPVVKFKKSLIRWKLNGTPIRYEDSRLTLLPDNSIRIRNTQDIDAGEYTCVAGNEESSIYLSLIAEGETPDISSHGSEVFEDDDKIEAEIDIDPVHNDFLPTDSKNRFPSSGRQNTPEKYIQNDQTHSSEILPAFGREIGHLLPASILTFPTLNESRAMSPDPVTIRLRHDEARISHVGPKSFDIIPSTERKGRMKDIRSAEDELTRLLAADGISMSDKEMESILLNLSEISTPIPSRNRKHNSGNEFSQNSGGIKTIEILPPPKDIHLVPLDQEIPDNHNIDGVFDIDRPEDSRSVFPSTDEHLSNKKPLSASGTLISINHDPMKPPLVPLTDNYEDYVEPHILIQPTEAPLQLDKQILTYVGGPLIVSEADSVTLLCEASGNPTPSISWLKDGIQIFSNDRRVILYDHSLRLLNPTRDDGGTYSCRAENLRGTDSLSTLLNVAVTPRILSTVENAMDLTSFDFDVTVGSIIKARLGGTLRIRCPAEGFPEPYVKWDKDVSGLGDNMRILADNTLEISPTTTADQGLFSCVASNPAGSDYQASALLLFDPPHVSEDMTVVPELEENGMYGFPQLLMTAVQKATYRIRAGSSVIMGCPVAGFPKPEMTWTFKGRPIEEFVHLLDHQLLLDGKVLQIPEINAGMDETFACIASNGGGNLTTTLKLQLIEYSYVKGNLTTCSATCGGNGSQYINVHCVEDGVKPVEDWYCMGMQKPIIKMVPCNRVNCPPKFFTGPWSPCSQTCGTGKRTRAVSCRTVMSDGSYREVADSLCSNNGPMSIGSDTSNERPLDRETCLLESCPTWETGNWSQCSRKCAGRGVGLRVRRLYCVKPNGTKVSRSDCKQPERPKRREYCANSKCHPVWITSRWSACSRTCGSDGIQTRILSCVYRGNRRQQAGLLCSKGVRPPVTVPCNRINCGQPSSVHHVTVACVDKSRYCSVAKSSGLCAYYGYLCCKTCSR